MCRDCFVPCCCCCCCCENDLTFGSNFCMLWWISTDQMWVIDATRKPTFVDEVKTHISRLKVIWDQVVKRLKCEYGLIWKGEVKLELNLVYWYNMGSFVCLCCQRSRAKVKGHQKSTFEIGPKWKIVHLIWKIEVQLGLNFVNWYNVGAFTCLWGQMSQMKVRGHVRPIFKIIWKCSIWLIYMHVIEEQWQYDPARWGSRSGQFASSTNRDGRWQSRSRNCKVFHCICAEADICYMIMLTRISFYFFTVAERKEELKKEKKILGIWISLWLAYGMHNTHFRNS